MKHLPGCLKVLAALALFGAVLLFAVLLVVRFAPQTGAAGADALRQVIGDAAVARLEAVLFKIDDTLQGIEYRANLARPSPPWRIASLPTLTAIVLPSPTTPPTLAPGLPTAAVPGAAATLPALPTQTAAAILTAMPAAAPFTPSPAPTTPPAQWTLAPVPPLGTLPGEGQWEPYIQDAAGRVLAYKTFLQPDPSRPYTVTAVVAFRLEAVRLHFVIGFESPYAQDRPSLRSAGTIPAGDRAPGVLLAAFNGGFKYAHGRFGAMANGLVSVPPRDGLATVAMLPDGRVRLGAWGTDIPAAGDYLAYRQNGPLAIREGQVTKEVSDPKYWGFTITGATVTWRSGLGLSQDGGTLYYFAGPYLTIDVLTRVMAGAGAWNAMQLDINNYWVHFDAFHIEEGELVPDPLFPKEMEANPRRFLSAYARDYFYITNGK